MAFSMNLNATSQVYPAPASLADKIEDECKRVNKIICARILSGFDLEYHDGVTYHFSFKLDDQTNFLMKLNEANMIATADATALDSDDVFCTWQGHIDGTAKTLTFSLAEFMNFATTAGHIKEKHLGDGWVMKAKLRAAKSPSELKAVVDALDLVHLEVAARDLPGWAEANTAEA